jgi:protein-S-isoprenylcysteine O-methyltransferase Ste14
MEAQMSIADFFHRTATGPKRQRVLLTPVGLLVFGGTLVIVIAGGLVTDRALRLPALLPRLLCLAVGGPIMVAGALLCGWCVVRFWKARGTPVPMNPPEELITNGPYGWVRNPMVTGVFGALFGLGLILDSMGMALIWTPAYVLFHWIELKRVEEPELTRRFGNSYLEYKKRVPMFIPRLMQLRERRAPSNTR